jgi:L,D-peptidoglycan transpeptidase YkuD (ErfK/YbiS/YcfS/YnhG family)
MNTIYANFKTYQKSSGTWNQIINIDSRIGTNGLVYDNVRIEGDLRTPVGVYSLPYAFGTASNPGTKLPYKSIGANTYFDGQYGSSTYDQLVEGQPNNNEWETMNIVPYKYGLLINFNPEQKVGKGNAIFLHLPTSSGATAGCVSIDENSMLQVLKWLSPNQNPRIVICPTSDLGNYYN